MTTQHHGLRRRLTHLLVGAVAAGSVTLASQAPARAATPLGGGEILITTFGGLDGSGIDKLDRLTLNRSRWTTLGLGFQADKMTVLADKRIAVGNKFGDIVLVNPANGATQQIRNDAGGDTFDVPYTGFAPTTDGRLATIVNYTSGGRLVLIDTTTGAMKTISSSDVVDQAGDLVVRANGDIIVTSFNQLWKVNPATGVATAIAGLGAHGDTMTIDRKGNVYVHVEASQGHSPRIMKLDPVTDLVTTIAEGGDLTNTSFGMAVESTGFLVVDDIGTGGQGLIIRVDPNTGLQRRIATMSSSDETRDVAVAGVAEVGGTEVPVALDDFASLESQDGQIIVDTLENDRDPRGSELHYTTVSQPQHGFISDPANGSIFYFPNGGYVGTDSWTYKAISADGRESKPATVHINVLPSVSPRTKDDAFSIEHGAALNLPAPGILANDSDPQGMAGVSSTLAIQPAHGTLTLTPIGGVQYSPSPTFTGVDEFLYQLTDAEGHSSGLGTVRITVTASDTGGSGGSANTAPSLVIATGPRLRAGPSGRSGTFPINLTDLEGGPLSLRSTSSKRRLVSPKAIKIADGPTGGLLVTISASNQIAGKAVVTLKASDGSLTTTLRITVLVGNGRANRLRGTAGADLILGANGADRVSGRAGRDVILGGAGNDVLNGGAGRDLLRGGAGRDQLKNR